MRDADHDLAICDAATPGPWTMQGGGFRREPVEPNCGIRRAFEAKEDAEFTCAARTALPYWIHRAVEAEKEAARLRAALKRTVQYCADLKQVCVDTCRFDDALQWRNLSDLIRNEIDPPTTLT